MSWDRLQCATLRSGSTLVHVVAWCLTAPSHYLNQSWIIFSEVSRHSHESNYTGNAQDIYPWYDYQFKITATSPRGQCVKARAGVCRTRTGRCLALSRPGNVLSAGGRHRDRERQITATTNVPWSSGQRIDLLIVGTIGWKKPQNWLPTVMPRCSQSSCTWHNGVGAHAAHRQL